MARLLVVFDPTGKLQGMPADARESLGIKEAALDIADNLADRDVYELSRKLAELLLEQLSRA